MENILKQSKEKVEEFVFGKDGVNGLYEKKYKKIHKEMIIMSLALSPLFFGSLIVLIIAKTSGFKDYNETLIVAEALMMFFLSSAFFILSASSAILGSFSLEKAYRIDKYEIKTKKLRETPLSLKVLNEMTPLMGKIQEKLPEEEFIELMEIAEIETGEKLGNAYYFLYLIENYDELLSKVRERKEDGKNLQKKLSALRDFNKENPL